MSGRSHSEAFWPTIDGNDEGDGAPGPAPEPGSSVLDSEGEEDMANWVRDLMENSSESAEEDRPSAKRPSIKRPAAATSVASADGDGDSGRPNAKAEAKPKPMAKTAVKPKAPHYGT